jgi:signal transduction histidine kinase
VGCALRRGGGFLRLSAPPPPGNHDVKERHFAPSPLALVIAAVLVLLSVGGYFLLQHSVDQQETALLQTQTTDAGATASSLFSNVLSTLTNDAAELTLTGPSPSKFEQFVNPNGEPNKKLASVNLVHRTAAGYVVVAATGTGLTTGETLSGPALSTVENITGTMAASGPVTSNGVTSYGRFAIRVLGDYYVYEQFNVSVHHVNLAAVVGSAFSELNIAFYGPGPISPHNLLVATTTSLPLAGPTAHSAVTVGASKWTLVASAKQRFVSGLASSGPLILLILGLLIAVIVALTIDTVQRRHRYAQILVEERTADLNASLRELKETQDALVRGERLSAVGEMASVIGHELRNPLAAVTNSLFIIRNNLGDQISPTTEKYLSLAERETTKAATLADDMTAFVRPRDPVKTEIDARALVEEVLSATPHPENVDVNLDVDAIDLVGDRLQLAEVLTNLVTNAYQAMPDGGRLRLGAHANGTGVVLVVEDSGRGVDGSVLGQVFEPFFTTRSSGTGLGLAIVQRLVQAHDGEVLFENVPGGGVRVTITLPTVSEVVSA